MKKYQIIYADPPWHYRYRFGSGIAENHYPTMSIDELKALPVKELADKDCALFLWITCPMLNKAWEVIEAWGFTYLGESQCRWRSAAYGHGLVDTGQC